MVEKSFAFKVALLEHSVSAELSLMSLVIYELVLK